MPGFLTIPTWETFQHYKKRSPIWIKLYLKLADNEGYWRLPDASKGHLVGLWILAAKKGNAVPFEPDWITSQIGANSPVSWQLLLAQGFIELDSNALAYLSNRASLETETETERETETEGETKVKDSASKKRKRLEGQAEGQEQQHPMNGDAPASLNGKGSRKGRPSWLTPYADAWTAVLGGEPAFGELANRLATPHKNLGGPECLRRWSIYLAATDPAFVNPARFAATVGAWTGVSWEDAKQEQVYARFIARGRTDGQKEPGHA